MPQTSRQSFWAIFGQLCTSHAHKLLFRSFDQNSDIAIRFRDLERAIIWRSDDVFML